MAKRVLLINEFGVLNGGENSLLAVLPSLAPEFSYSAIVPHNSELSKRLEELGIEVLEFRFRDPNGARKPLDQLRSELETKIKFVGPDLVHCNSMSVSRIVGPVTATIKQASLGYIRDIMKMSQRAIGDLNQIDRLIAVSHATRDFHIEQGVDSEKLQTIYNGVDTDQFSPSLQRNDLDDASSLKAELGIPASTQLILFCGQLGMRKGIDILLRAFVLIGDQTPNTELVVVGERNSQKAEAVEFMQNNRDFVRQHDLESKVHWLGRRSDIAEIMRQSNLLIHPARQEPLGRVLLESCASGLVPLTTNVGGSAEILAGKLSRLLVNSGDEMAIATEAIELLRNDELRKELAIGCRTRILSHFSTRQCVSKLREAYLQVM